MSEPAVHEAWQYDDGRTCPFYRGKGVCVTGCWTEPICQTNEPVDGWPEVEGPFECDCDEPESHAEVNAIASRGLAEKRRARMLARREQLMAERPDIITAAEFAPLMGDLEQEYWQWNLERYFTEQEAADAATRTFNTSKETS